MKSRILFSRRHFWGMKSFLCLLLMPFSLWAGALYQCVDKSGVVSITDRWDKGYTKCVPLDYYQETPGQKNTAGPESAPILEGAGAGGSEKRPVPEGTTEAVLDQGKDGTGVTGEGVGEATEGPQAEEQQKKKPAYWPPRK